MSIELTVTNGQLVLDVGENTTAAAAYAAIALGAAEIANAANNYFSTSAEGEAATVEGDFFSYPDYSGQIIFAERGAVGHTIVGSSVTKAAIDSAVAQAEAARDLALIYRDGSIAAANLFPNTAAALGNGLSGYTSLVGGTGGSDGLYDLIVTGGTQVNAPVGKFKVTGGVVTDIFISEVPNQRGYFTVNPTGFNFSASGVTGASAVPTVSPNTTNGQRFQTPSGTSEGYVDLYYNNAGAASTVQSTLPSKAKLDATVASVAPVKSAISSWLPVTATVEPGFFYRKDTGAKTANVNYRSFKVAVDSSKTYRAYGLVSGSTTQVALAVYYAANGTTVLGSEVASTGSGSGFFQEKFRYTLTMPTGTAFVAISSFITNTAGFQSTPALDVLDTSTSFGNDVTRAVNSLKEGNKWSERAPSSPAVSSSYYNKDGSVVSNSSYSITKYTLTGNEESIRVSFSVTSTAVLGIVYLDASDTVIGTDMAGTGTQVNHSNVVLDVPLLAKKVAISSLSAQTTKLEVLGFNSGSSSASSNRWSGRVVLVSGDSIFANAYEKGPVANLAPAELGATGYALACGGRTLTGHTDNYADRVPSTASQAMEYFNAPQWAKAAAGKILGTSNFGDQALAAQRAIDLDPTLATGNAYSDMRARVAAIQAVPSATFAAAYLMSFNLGTNDIATSVPIGTAESTNTLELKGAMNYIVQTLLTAKPTMFVVFGTPIWRDNDYGPGSTGTDSNVSTNSLGLKMSDYQKAIIDQAAYLECPVLEMHRHCGINKYNAATLLQNDKLHPKNDGQTILAKTWSLLVNQVVP